jgi:hypothetical protein
MRRVIQLPGSASPLFGRYREVYSTIEAEAKCRGYVYHQMVYPGQNGKSSGVLAYDNAIEQVESVCREFEPTWLIGISLGAVIAAGLLASACSWSKTCEGAVLWGAYSGETLRRRWSSEWERKKEIRVHSLKANTFLASNYFDVHPAIEGLIGNSCSDLRLARGSTDTLCTQAELEFIAQSFRRSENPHHMDLVEVEGADHLVGAADTDPITLPHYYDALFGDILSRNP